MTACSRLEPIPTDYHIPGNFLSSPGCGEVYEVISFPVCRLYEDHSVAFEENGVNFKYRFQPNALEYRSNKKKGEGNHLSYLVRYVNFRSKTEFYITNQFLKKG